MKIGIGNDHVAVELKEIIKEHLEAQGYEVVDFGTLYLTDASNELETVEVVAQKPLVKADIDKIEYSVKDDPDAETNSVLEMLRKTTGEEKTTV